MERKNLVPAYLFEHPISSVCPPVRVCGAAWELFLCRTKKKKRRGEGEVGEEGEAEMTPERGRQS